ncbi:hypothetical protein MKX03_007877, partial [Papaver bracteatum]
AANIILVNPQLISIPTQYHEDPYDMFNEYIMDMPADTDQNQSTGMSNEIARLANNNNQ